MNDDPISAICKTYRDAIRTYLNVSGNLADRTVAISEDGRPHPACGQEFYGIVPGQLGNNTPQGYTDAYLSMSIVITLRAPVVPVDKSGDELIVKLAEDGNTRSGGLMARAWNLHQHLKSNRYSLLNEANVLLGGDNNTRGFVEPFVLSSITYLGVKGPDWFWAAEQDLAPSGLAIQINYHQLRYLDGE